MTNLPPAPQISVQTLPITSLLVDVYGLAELSPKAHNVSVLWLHHPRTKNRANMADIASRCVGAWNAFSGSRERGLIAIAWDQRNHGSRLVDETSNGAWREGNPNHALDMWGMINGMVQDQSLLLDVIEGYLFPKSERSIDQHLALGISLGGHSVWQLVFADKRIRAGVMVIGCPDYQLLMTDRARLSRLPTYSAQDNGDSFIGSKDFPLALINACRKYDPKGIFFGTYAVPSPETEASVPKNSRLAHQAYIRQQMLYERLQGKKLLICQGGQDKLVPLRASEPFMQWFKHHATAATPGREDQRFSVDERVYPGIGHEFSAEMVKDAVQFIVHAVAGAKEDKFNREIDPLDGSGGGQVMFSSKL
ncbi:hypothetical protein QBC35DRAFT_159973 [Podospora australis]|uniref:AB hydrolase-1 domain-containing protein n=1 Tax=Podospora australis TaxID=1536484 RepID=A0AAN7AMV5_9PEZI|nr:hypothetical protein QBC35DRAFT_159973 [Podospora australis]